MSDEEKKSFENELSNSNELSIQLEKYRSVLNGLKVDKFKFSNEDYFTDIIPNFRRKQSIEKKTFKVKTAYALTLAVSVLAFFFIVFNPFKTTENGSLEKVISTVNENEALELYDYYSDIIPNVNSEQLNGVSDSLFSELISTEFDIQEGDLKSLVSLGGISTENLFSEIQSEEAELIYNEILKKKYF
jgi:hypothetical protein